MDDIESILRKLLQEHIEAIGKKIEDAIRRELTVQTGTGGVVVYFDDLGNPWREATRADVGQFARFGDHGFKHAMYQPHFDGFLQLSNNTHYPFCGNGTNFRNAYIRLPQTAKD